ncbi:uncharacterized protein LOC134251304 [Saccostrea cucullata]|uniref:uncharacterized protein LOC134251304 n=1 Tax=Saccostrea cuccullata TaxID=36930 RepID=UPI002ED2504C
MTEVGGFRDLWNDTQFVKQELYSRVSSQQAIHFLFDFLKPTHCSVSGGCTKNFLSPFKIPNDASKAPFTFDVKGWSDIPSGIVKYTLVVHKLMKKSNSNLLTIEAKRNPFHLEERNVAALPFPKFLPSSSGVYAFILKVTDEANNSEFARQIAIFDPYSTISTTAESNFFVSSAEKLGNYSWQSRGSYIQFTWENYFINAYQVENHLLLPVEEFSIDGRDTNINEEEEKSKGEDVKYLYDDHDGKRTLSGVEHVNGITGFDVFYSYISYLTSSTNDGTTPSDEPFNLTNTNTTAELAATNTSNKMRMKRSSHGSLPATINPNTIENTFAPTSVEPTTPTILQASRSGGTENKWIAIRNITQSTFVLKQEWRDGDSINISVRARDIMNNTKTESRLVSFDGSPPSVNEAIFTKNVGNSSYKYSSRVSIMASDEHSGVRQVRWRLTDKAKQDEIYKEGYLRNDPIQRSECSTIDDCYCIPMGECYKKKMEFDFDNCWLATDKSLLTKDIFVLEIEAFNQAMLSSEVTRYELGRLTSFDGIDDGYGIRNLTSESFGNGTKLTWENVPSCYKISDVTVLLYNDCDKAKAPRQITLPTTKTEYVLDDLQ